MGIEHRIRDFLTENCATKLEISDALHIHWKAVQAVLDKRKHEWSITCDPELKRTITRFHEGEVCRYWHTRPNPFPARLLKHLRVGEVLTKDADWATARTILKGAEILQRYGAGIRQEYLGKGQGICLTLTHDLPLRLWPIDGVFPKLPVAIAPSDIDLQVVQAALDDGCLTIDDIHGHTAMAKFRAVGYKKLSSLEKFVPQLTDLKRRGYTVEDLEDIPDFLSVYGMSKTKIGRAMIHLQGERAPHIDQNYA